ncbi:hypothetical protein HRbin08_00497 [bacterium HR08]|nr:hypothetical protein HRbin08_00497 [bacterium HR08]
MRRRLGGIALGLILCGVGRVEAQEVPRVEVFAGYSYARLAEAISSHGWTVSMAGNVNSWFGIAADVSGHYRSDLSLYSYTVGPRFALRDTVTAFTHFLFGGARLGDGGALSAFGMVFGGGVDVPLKERFTLRLLQADYLFTRFGGETQNNARLSVGIVFTFGRH